jgi:hypothetical protein
VFFAAGNFASVRLNHSQKSLDGSVLWYYVTMCYGSTLQCVMVLCYNVLWYYVAVCYGTMLQCVIILCYNVLWYYVTMCYSTMLQCVMVLCYNVFLKYIRRISIVVWDKFLCPSSYFVFKSALQIVVKSDAKDIY